MASRELLEVAVTLERAAKRLRAMADPAAAAESQWDEVMQRGVSPADICKYIRHVAEWLQISFEAAEVLAAEVPSAYATGLHGWAVHQSGQRHVAPHARSVRHVGVTQEPMSATEVAATQKGC